MGEIFDSAQQLTGCRRFQWTVAKRVDAKRDDPPVASTSEVEPRLIGRLRRGGNAACQHSRKPANPEEIDPAPHRLRPSALFFHTTPFYHLTGS
jgi:hypothetical protein